MPVSTCAFATTPAAMAARAHEREPRRGQRAQQRVRAAGGDGERRGVHGAFWQFSLESRIQSRPDCPFPGAPREPQSDSFHCPLGAKLRILSMAFM